MDTGDLITFHLAFDVPSDRYCIKKILFFVYMPYDPKCKPVMAGSVVTTLDDRCYLAPYNADTCTLDRSVFVAVAADNDQMPENLLEVEAAIFNRLQDEFGGN